MEGLISFHVCLCIFLCSVSKYFCGVSSLSFMASCIVHLLVMFLLGCARLNSLLGGKRAFRVKGLVGNA